MDGFAEKLASKLHHYSVLPFSDVNGTVDAVDPFVLTNYTFFLIIAFVITLAFFLVAARRVSIVPQGIGQVAEAGYEFIRNLCVDNMGKDGAKYAPFIGTLFFFILFNNVIGLVPGALPGTGSIGVTATWALMVFIVYNAIGFKKNGVIGYLKSFVPSGVREMGPGGRFTLGPFIFVLELVGHFLRPLTLAVRLYANMFAGGIILGIFGIFMILGAQQLGALGITMTGFGFMMLVIMYGFKVFVAFIQAYVFAILTSVYIGGALHASEH
ncbi:MAG: F0F1 ATP synthase subunit A [Anaerosomatales bacterium]|nr:F0F1 ATP synthase subunit A [Anaerosomatales bacterium]MDT8434754.1 F0F1 ATP synthase subunit A [Anaerosomatales bacterium]